jgi:tol-pal system protein YbgF
MLFNRLVRDYYIYKLILFSGLYACSSSQDGTMLSKMQTELAEARTTIRALDSKVEKLSQLVFIMADKIESNKVEISRTQPPRRLKVVRLTPRDVTVDNRQKPMKIAINNTRKIKAFDAPKKPRPQPLYDKALSLVRAKQYDEAEVLFLTFISHFPTHDYADNVYYWMGESYYDRKKYQKSVDLFLQVIEKYPDGNKVPDALLKLSYSYLKLKMRDEALMNFRELIATYPRSIAAKKARVKLMELDPTAE